MGRLAGFVVFLCIVLLVLVGLHAYLWVRLIRDPQWPTPWRGIATTVLFVAGAGVPLTLLLRRTSHGAMNLLVWPGYMWIGLMFLLVVALAGADLVRLILWIGRKVGDGDGGAAAIDPMRRAFFARWIAGGALATVAGVGTVATRAALAPVAVRRVEVPLRRLSRQQDGMTLVQLTDLHIGPTIRRRELASLVQRTNEIAPDVVVITGDLVDGGVDELRDSVAPLADLRAKHGVFFVTGNHEYFSGASAWVREISDLGIRVLRNERVTIGPAESGFQLAGVDDRSAARYPQDGHGEDLAKALAGRDTNRAVVLLAHQPRTVLDSAKLDVDLQLSGHTHGGQIWPFGFLVRLQQGFLAGLGRHGDTFIYVSRGTGYWGPPMRLVAPAEITQIVLRSAA
ncbi:MAG: metallophosphoesterase [Pseudomonadota bacterium]